MACPGPFAVKKGGGRTAGGERRESAPAAKAGAGDVLRLLFPLAALLAGLFFCAPEAQAGSKLYFRDTTAPINPGSDDERILTDSAGSAAVAYVKNTGAGGTVVPPTTATQFTRTDGGTTVIWYSSAVVAVTISGNVTFNLWAKESANTANATITAELLRADNSGTILSTIASVVADRAELGTGITVQNWSAAAAPTTLNTGDRLAVRVYIDNVGTMGSAKTVTMDIAGGTAGADGDSWVQLSEEVASTDFTLNQSDMVISPTSTNWNQAVLTSATVRNLYPYLPALTEKYDGADSGSGYYVDALRPQAQGFVVSVEKVVTAVEIEAWDYGTLGEKGTVKITTGTTSLPSVGAQVLASTNGVIGASYAWFKFTFNDPVRLPVLPAGDAYWLIASNSNPAANGWAWLYMNANSYAAGPRAYSTDGGSIWATSAAEDMLFRIHQSSFAVPAVSFYDGDPDSGGTLIGTQSVEFSTQSARLSTMTWTTTLPEGTHNIYIHIDRSALIPETDDNNNKNYNTVSVSSAPSPIRVFSASAYNTTALDLNWYATGDDADAGTLNSAYFILQYTSATAWAEGTSWSTDTSKVPAYVSTVEISTTGVAAGSQRLYRVSSLPYANTRYYFRIWTKDDVGAYSPLSSGATASTLADAAANSQIYKVYYSSVTVNWKQHPASPEYSTCEGYTLQASTASNFTGLVYSSVTYNINSATLTITSLGTNSTYYFRVASLNWNYEPNYASAVSTCTLKPPPGAPPYEPEITGIYLSSMTMRWIQVGADDGYVVEASTAVDFTGTITSSETAIGTLEELTVYDNPPLLANTTYYMRVGSLWGETTSYAATQIATTLATLADPVEWALFKDVYITSAAATWKGLPEEPRWETCEGYSLEASTVADWTGTIYSSATPSVLLTTLTVAGLSPNVTYYFRLGTLNWNNVGNYLTLITTPTLASSPLNTSVISASSYSLTAQWTSGSPANASGTTYVLNASSTNFDGTGEVFSSTTTDLQTGVSGLMPNTTYYLRPKALNWAERATYGTTTSSSTLTAPVSGGQLYDAHVTSVTVNWLQFPADPSSSTCRGYILQASTASDFTGEIFSSATVIGVVPSTLTVKDLYSETWYYFRAGAYNWNWVPNYVSLGSIKTEVPVPPPDLMLTSSDIKFSPSEADFGQVVIISATIRNLSYNFIETAYQKQEATGGSGYYVDTLRPQGQGFVVSADLSVTALDLNIWDLGSGGETGTVEITTGTTSLPSVGAQVLASTSRVVGTVTDWYKFTLNAPVRLPVLSAGNAYWIIAKNSSSANNGWAWSFKTLNPYTPASRALSADGGASWTTSTDDMEFRVYQTSNVVVSFYDGDADSGGTYIGVSTTAAINTNKTALSTMSWTAVSPEAYHSIYAYIDKANEIGESDETNNKAYNIIAISSAPDAVRTLSASTYSTTEIKLTWNPTGDDGAAMPLNNARFIIQYTSVAAWAEGTSWSTNTATLPYYVYTTNISTSVTNTNTNTYIQTGLGVNATYYFRLWTQDDFGRYSALSTGTTVCTLAAAPWIPYEPFTAVYFSSVSVSWLANGNPDYTYYRLQASTASNFTGDLYGAYIGPSGWMNALSSTTISLLGCTTYYFRAQARNQASIETDFQTLGSTKTVVYYDCGLRMHDGTQKVAIACQPVYCTGDAVSPVRMHKNGTNCAVGVVDVADPKASRLKVQLNSGVIKAYRKY